MPHRDKDCRTPRGTNAQDLQRALDGLLAGIDWRGIEFRRDCGWATRGLVAAALVWAWSSRDTLKERFRQALKFARGQGRNVAPLKTSYQAFIKLLVRWTPELRERLGRAFQRCMEREFPEEFRLAGYVVLAGDGSKLQLPRTLSNEARYSPAKTRGRKGKKRRKAERARRRRSRQARAQHAKHKKADSPQMALTLLYHVLQRLPWDWRVGPSDSSERDHLRDMIPHLPDNALITADCGFVGYEFWSDLLTSGRQFVIRVGGNVRLLKKLGVAREADGTVYLWPNKVAKRRQPPLMLRLVVVHDGRQPWYLVTSVRSTRRLSDQQIATIYKCRWRIELFFRHFKQTFGRTKLRSYKAEHAECEAQWSLLGLWAMLLHARRQQPPHSGCLSVARILRAFGQTIDEQKCLPDTGESLNELLSLATIDSYQRRNKTSRDHPRKKYESPAKPPSIQNATRSQRQLTKQIMSSNIKLRLPA